MIIEETRRIEIIRIEEEERLRIETLKIKIAAEQAASKKLKI